MRAWRKTCNLPRRAIDNVLRNASRYAPAGTEIQLDCKVDLTQREVTLDILDSAPGVPDAMPADLFKAILSHRTGCRAICGDLEQIIGELGGAVRSRPGKVPSVFG
jgi:nitrogen-specific signal transduction histidine kinase